MRIDRRTLLRSGAAVVAATTFTCARQLFARDQIDPAIRERLDTVLRNATRRGDFPGVVAAITDRNNTIYEGAFGARALGQDAAITMDAVFSIRSMTKPIAATAAMQLVEQGKLDLQSPISRWVPNAAKLQVLGGWDSSGEPRLRAPKREITLRDLLTHTAGFAYRQWDADLDRYMKVKNFPELYATGKEEAFYLPLMFDPGERWEYGISMDWAGKLVEVVSGKTLGAYMQENIFSPLGMMSTGYKLTPDMETRRVTSHRREQDGLLTQVEWKGQPQPVYEFGGTGLYSTAGDYLRFMRMILNRGTANGNQVLKPDTVKLMSQNAMGDIRVAMLKTTNPAVSEDAEFFPGLPKSWGLSFMINEETAPTGRPAGSLAWAGLFNTLFWIDPAAGIGGLFMTQVLPFGDKKTLAGFYEFERAFYQPRS
jgi:CubicO group peptidase (beta-lactamase class C family)